jgi:large repetitive protein
MPSIRAIHIRTLRTSVLVASVATTVAVSAGHAEASHVTCGDTITVDTRLDSDLVNCPNNGIVIGADDVTLDLNGHTVAGDGESVESCPEGEFCDIGLLNDGHDGVTVRNGSVDGFGIGAFIGRTRESRVLGISSSGNAFFGFIVAESARSLVRNSSGSRNLAPDGDGIGLFGSHDVRIVGNSFRHNPLGLHVEDSTDNLIRGNGFSGNDLGILMEADGNQVRRNRSVRDGGILVLGSQNVIARNRYSRGQAIGIETGRHNVVSRNVVVRPRRVGIRLGLDEPKQIGTVGTVVRRNRVKESGGDGFFVASKDKRSRLKGNVAVGSKDDGFDIASPSAKLSGNRALRSGDAGIERG